MSWLKKNWIKVGVCVLILSGLVVVREWKSSPPHTAFIANTIVSPTPYLSLQENDFKLSQLLNNQVVVERPSGDVIVKLYAAREELIKIDIENAGGGSWIGDTEVYGYYMLKVFKNGKEIYSRPITFNWDPVSSSNGEVYSLDDPKYTERSLSFIINGEPGSKRPHNGITLKKIPGYSEPLIAFYQYGTSSVEEIVFYRINDLGEIVPIMFENESFKYKYVCDSSECKNPEKRLIKSEKDIYRQWEDTDYDGEFYTYNNMSQFCGYTGMNSVIGFVCRSYKYVDGVFKYDSTQKYYAEQIKLDGGWGKGEMVTE
jgi:hypothetical protein